MSTNLHYYGTLEQAHAFMQVSKSRLESPKAGAKKLTTVERRPEEEVFHECESTLTKQAIAVFALLSRLSQHV